MANITIIGAGEAGIHFIKEVRSLKDNSKITLIDKRDFYFERRNILNCWIREDGCTITRFNDEFCSKHSLEYIKAVVERINPNTKRIFFKGHSSVDFDILVIAIGAVSKKLSIKGDFREGFFYLSDINPIDTRDYLGISKDVTVYASTILGIRIALFLSSLGKDVKLITGNLSFLGEYKERFIDLFRSRKVDIYFNCRIEEAIGESSVKAVRITSPKFLSSQVVFIDSGFTAPKIFSDSDIDIKDDFHSNCSDIYVLGEAANKSIGDEKFFINNAQNIRIQARSLAYHICRGAASDNTDIAPLAEGEFLEKVIEEFNKFAPNV